MKRLPRPRRSLWLTLGLVIVGLATAATVAVAGLQPADLSYTPKSDYYLPWAEYKNPKEHRRFPLRHVSEGERRASSVLPPNQVEREVPQAVRFVGVDEFSTREGSTLS